MSTQFWLTSTLAFSMAWNVCAPAAHARCRDDQPCVREPDDLAPQDPPAPVVSPPDLAFQIKPCLGALFEQQIAAALETDGMFAQSACVTNESRVGVWPSAALSDQTIAERQRGLESLAALRTQESFGVFISGGAISRKASEAFAAVPKRLNADGKADPSGQINILGFNQSMGAPATFTTRVNGVLTPPLSSAPFYLTLTDTLSTSGGRVTCSSTSSMYVDTGELVFSTVAGAVFFFPLGIMFGVELDAINKAPAPSMSGVGCAIASGLPTSRLLPAALRFDARYGRVGVAGNGLVAAGTHTLAFRSPSAAIHGSTSVDPRAVVSFRALTSDMREPLTYSWSSSAAIQGSAGAGSVTIAFPNGPATRSVAVHVVDADGLAADAALNVSVRGEPREVISSPCRNKPYLPNCL